MAERPVPQPRPGEVQVRVRIAGVNRADLLQVLGRYPPPAWAPPDILGLEFAGEISATGEGVARWRTGDRVMGIVAGGAQAEFVTVPADELLAVPDAWSPERAGALPESFLTAWDAMVIRAGVMAGDRIVCHSIGGGIGTAVAQIAPLLGVEVTGTSRSPWKLERAAALGVRQRLLLREGWTGAAAESATVIDTLGPAHLRDNLSVLRERGVLVVLGLLAGPARAELDMGKLLRKRLSVIGTVMRSRGAAERAALIGRFGAEFLPLAERAGLEPVVDSVFPADQVADAHRRVAENRTFGKVLLAF